MIVPNLSRALRTPLDVLWRLARVVEGAAAWIAMQRLNSIATRREPSVRLHVHRVASVGKVEVLLLLLAGSTEAEVTLLVDLGSPLAHVLCLTLLI